MKYLGYLILGFALVDFFGSFAGFDLWGSMGIALPEEIWRFSAYLEGALGVFLINLGSKDEEYVAEETDPEAGSDGGDPGDDDE